VAPGRWYAEKPELQRAFLGWIDAPGERSVRAWGIGFAAGKVHLGGR
jgi:hypothetical protein